MEAPSLTVNAATESAMGDKVPTIGQGGEGNMRCGREEAKVLHLFDIQLPFLQADGMA